VSNYHIRLHHKARQTTFQNMQLHVFMQDLVICTDKSNAHTAVAYSNWAFSTSAFLTHASAILGGMAPNGQLLALEWHCSFDFEMIATKVDSLHMIKGVSAWKKNTWG
jgi:hypothetical protein